ncbi:hypothetical protein FB451DRAFT_1550670 [Mycena latifolia]|nr:hypothetical protein FB451DRAFT_1550670 [Mycena latifolia]
MQFKLIAFIAALFTVATAQTGCVTILKRALCPVGYHVCGPVVVGQTKCCFNVHQCVIHSNQIDICGM